MFSPPSRLNVSPSSFSNINDYIYKYIQLYKSFVFLKKNKKKLK